MIRNKSIAHFGMESRGGESKKQKGASLVEYVLLVALVCIIVLSAVRALGSRVSREFMGVDQALEEAAGTSITG